MNSSATFQSKPNVYHSPQSFGSVYDLSCSLSFNRANEVGPIEAAENKHLGGFKPSAIVCRYYQSGGCVDEFFSFGPRNCVFKHTADKSDQPCRYHQTGFCVRGPHCHFRHDAPAAARAFVENYIPKAPAPPLSPCGQDTNYNYLYPPISDFPYNAQYIESLRSPPEREFAASDSALTGEGAKRRTFLKMLVPEHNNARVDGKGAYNREGNFYVDDFPPLEGAAGGAPAARGGSGVWDRRGGAAVRGVGREGAVESAGGGAGKSGGGGWSADGLGFGEEYMPPLEKVLRARLKDLKNEYFPHVPNEEIEKTFATVGKNPIHAIVLLGKKYGLPKPITGSGQTQNPNFSANNNYNNSQPKQEIIHKGRSEKWVETGDPLNSIYSENRSKAIEHAEKRNRLLSRANEAFRNGDRAVSREMSQKAKAHDAEMRRLHATARENIFKERNRGFGTGETKRTIDLHGLHRSEAAAMLTEKINEYKQCKSVKYLDILVGTGHHSNTGKSVLLQSVIDYLDKRRYKYRTLPAGGQGGAIRMSLL